MTCTQQLHKHHCYIVRKRYNLHPTLQQAQHVIDVDILFLGYCSRIASHEGRRKCIWYLQPQQVTPVPLESFPARVDIVSVALWLAAILTAYAPSSPALCFALADFLRPGLGVTPIRLVQHCFLTIIIFVPVYSAVFAFSRSEYKMPDCFVDILTPETSSDSAPTRI